MGDIDDDDDDELEAYLAKQVLGQLVVQKTLLLCQQITSVLPASSWKPRAGALDSFALPTLTTCSGSCSAGCDRDETRGQASSRQAECHFRRIRQGERRGESPAGNSPQHAQRSRSKQNDLLEQRPLGVAFPLGDCCMLCSFRGVSSPALHLTSPDVGSRL